MVQTLLGSARLEFSQPGNTLGTTEEDELLVLECERQLPDDPPFFVLRTTGWSIDSIEELQVIIDMCERIMQDVKWSPEQE